MRKVKHKKTGGISFPTAMLFICFVVVIILFATRLMNNTQQKARLKAENSSLIAQSNALSEQLRQIRAQEEMGKDNTSRASHVPSSTWYIPARSSSG